MSFGLYGYTLLTGFLFLCGACQRGMIFGSGNNTNWTQVLSYGRKKYKFYNPIKQNNNHIKELRKTLKQFEEVPFFSVIVFFGDCELKEVNCDYKKNTIMNYKDFIHNKETKTSNLLGVLYVIVVTIVTVSVVYWTTKL